MRSLLWLVCSILCLSPGCQEGEGGGKSVLIDVTIQELPPQSRSLKLSATLSGNPVQIAEERSTEPLDRFEVELPLGSDGLFVLEAAAFDAGRCLLARGRGEVVLRQAGRFVLTVPLAREPTPGCDGDKRQLLTVQKSGDGRGRVLSEPAGIDCGATCEASFQTDAMVQLVAEPEPGSAFDGWSGACSGAGACLLSLGQKALVGARFTRSPTAPTCKGWCWESPLPHGNTIHRMSALSKNDIWAVGALGTLIHFDGTAWSLWPSGTSEDLYGVWAGGKDNLWVVGDHGTVRRFDGARWETLKSDTRETLRAVWGSGPNQVFVVGDSGTLLRWDGVTLYPVPSGLNDLVDVSGSGPDNVCPIIREYGMVLRFDGMAFTQRTVESGGIFHSIHVREKDDVWLAGWGGGLVRFDGTTFQKIDTGGVTETLRGVAGSGPNNIYAVGEKGTVLRFDGTSVKRIESGTSAWLFSIAAPAPDGVWLGGQGGTLFHHDGRNLALRAGGDTRTLFGLSGAAPDDLWAVGQEGAILHYDGVSWTQVPSGTKDYLWSVFAAGKNDVWAAGSQGLLLHFDGTAFKKVDAAGTRGSLHAIWGSSSKDVWAVGDRVMLRWDGTKWKQVFVAGLEDMFGLSGAAADHVLAVGEKGTILRFDGTSWSKMQSDSYIRLLGVHCMGRDRAIAVGEGGGMTVWDGTSWKGRASGVGLQLQTVAGTWDDAWIAGAGSHQPMVHFKAGLLTLVPALMENPVRALMSPAPGQFVAAGGGLLRYRP